MKETTKIIFTDALGREHTETIESSPKDSADFYEYKLGFGARQISDKREQIKKGKD